MTTRPNLLASLFVVQQTMRPSLCSATSSTNPLIMMKAAMQWYSYSCHCGLGEVPCLPVQLPKRWGIAFYFSRSVHSWCVQMIQWKNDDFRARKTIPTYLVSPSPPPDIASPIVQANTNLGGRVDIDGTDGSLFTRFDILLRLCHISDIHNFLRQVFSASSQKWMISRSALVSTTVLIIFSPSCIHCRQTFPQLQYVGKRKGKASAEHGRNVGVDEEQYLLKVLKINQELFFCHCPSLPFVILLSHSS